MAWLVRTWNLFHGNTVPPGRRAYLEAMIRLATADRPAVVCLQEVPAWAVGRLERWSDMTAIGIVAAYPRLGSAELGRLLTEVNHGVLRSAFTGQANAILVDRALDATDDRAEQISDAGERRVCQAVRVAGVGVVANFHATGGALADGQFRRAVAFAEAVAADGEPLVLCGDVNLTPGQSSLYAELRDRGYSPPAPGIDQILVRGLPATAPAVWAAERRRVDGRLLSDHAPVDVEVG
ncbi:MAG: endonuclease/exonuclease/phosphatase family protein [Actinobacteria bacterium]|nr:endonuclease/exonuclease/phosphatase family protein [Actinomycetota bacterium]